jgi:multiple sugar transport system ATP-binding protein
MLTCQHFNCDEHYSRVKREYFGAFMTQVTLQHIVKEYESGKQIIPDLSLTINPGELLVLVGPSGCGKSTVLRMIAGLEDITGGQLLFDDQIVNDMPSKARDIGMVFQNYALYPHLSVAENLGFPLSLRKVNPSEIKKRVQEVAELVGLETLLDRKPKQLSGGQRQRVALGRAIIRTPRVFLFDEPLSNLDAQLRLHMRAEIVNLQKRLGITGIYVTHDQAEAMTMGDRIAVLNKGKLMQIGTPQEIYQSPNNLFVAGFLGSPNMNFFKGTAHLERDVIHFTEENGGAIFTIPHSVLSTQISIPKQITVGIRPEHCSIQAYEISGPIWNTAIDQSEYHGHEMILHMLSGGTRKSMRLPVSEIHPNGKNISVHFDVNHICIFSTETGERL